MTRPRLLRLGDAAKYIGMAKSSLRRMATAGEIACVPVTLPQLGQEAAPAAARKTGRIYFRVEDLDAWVDAHVSRPAPVEKTGGLARICELPMPAIRRFG